LTTTGPAAQAYGLPVGSLGAGWACPLAEERGNDDPLTAASLYGSVRPVATLAQSAPAVGAGATHAEFDIVGAVFPCPNATFTVQSGTIFEVLREGTSSSGNQMFSLTDVPRHVVLTDEAGATYAMHGATWFGGVTIDKTGAEVLTATHNLEIVGPGGGVVASVRLMERLRNGVFVSRDFGSCELP
jgi:hypothetical protein